MEGSREDLIFDLAYKLQRVPVKKPKLTADEAAIYARHLVDHLELCGWRLTKQRPARAHSTLGYRDD